MTISPRIRPSWLKANMSPDWSVFMLKCGLEEALMLNPIILMDTVTDGVNLPICGEACAGEDRGAAEAPGLFDGMAI